MKYVDTLDIQFVLRLNEDALLKIKQRLEKRETTKYEETYVGSHPNKLYTFFYICRGYYLIVNVKHDAIKNVESSEELQEKVIQMIIQYFNISRNNIVETKICRINNRNFRITTNKIISAVEINRIDFKNDFRMTSAEQDDFKQLNQSVIKQDEKYTKTEIADVKNTIEEHQKETLETQFAIQNIFEIATDKIFRYKKMLYKYKDRTNCTYSNTRKGSIVINCYFKEYERLEDEDVETANKYKDILRTEIQLNNKHLNSQKKVRNKTLANYFKIEVADAYFKKYVQKIFYTESFYRLDVALKIIQSNSTLKEFVKERLCKFLTTINKEGFTYAKKHYDSSTFNKYIKAVRELGINPLTFSQTINNKEISIEKIENFALLENSVKEEI